MPLQARLKAKALKALGPHSLMDLHYRGVESRGMHREPCSDRFLPLAHWRDQPLLPQRPQHVVAQPELGDLVANKPADAYSCKFYRLVNWRNAKVLSLVALVIAGPAKRYPVSFGDDVVDDNSKGRICERSFESSYALFVSIQIAELRQIWIVVDKIRG